MKSRIFIFLALFSLMFSLLNAQSDAKAVKILTQSKEKFTGLNDFSARLKYTMENKALKQKGMVKNGNVNFKKGKYFINFEDQSLICDGKNCWVYLKDEKEVNLSVYDPKESMNLDRIYRIYEEQTRAHFDKEEIIGGTKFSKIQLFTQKKTTDYFKIELWINNSTKLVEKAKIFGRNGTTFQYDLTDIKTNTGVSESCFTFDAAKHPDVEVIDLR